ncbi:nuclease-related domain-containing DEAD/DEAH box helicase [Desulforamulus ferrireducens]|uniref:DNA helicase n=1 Tax=Desulforamulus ferrireducens TaxID=1833852 RepID=A0A1S6IXP1_9FIRM|nr:NERD domain-containing protein [Desulforamulus ferrireducens]AQS59526.1 hypothetical protein B0537_10805 [Desulforamulus ferrireducens]
MLGVRWNMARMIPSRIYEDCTSPGEQEIFRRLRDDPDTKDWIVLHSLDLANHRKQISGEIDFVVIVPNKGVLCIEVKACSRLSRRDGMWYYGRDLKPDSRGPFKQASEAMHSLRKKLVERRPDLARVVFWTAVIFPYVSFNVKSEEWHPWQVIDNKSFRSRPLGKQIIEILNNARNYLEKCPNASWFFINSKEPYIEQCIIISNILRPDFEFIENYKSINNRRDQELKRYTEEQFIALDAMESNPRIVFSGPAGTGKTLLAIEAARRSKDAGNKVLFLCFNRLLGKWLEEVTANLRPSVTTITLHRHMLKVYGEHIDFNACDELFWEKDLPLFAIEKLIYEPDGTYLYDEIICDEAQDIFRENYLDFLDLSLKGGLASGKWRFFGDFEKQAIFNPDYPNIEEFIKRRGIYAPIYTLRINCRNTPRVASMAEILGRMVPSYSKILRPDDKTEPEIYFFSHRDEQQYMLIEILSKLTEEGFIGKDIVILSPIANGSCASSINTKPWKDRIKPFDVCTGGYIGYTSIQAYKGLEAPAIIITDIEHVSGDIYNNLFYIALTRSTQRVIILARDRVKREIKELIVKNCS